MHYTIIPLDRVDPTDETFRITTRTDADDLVASIATDGLVAPPILVQKTARNFIIVSGFRRIAACRQLKNKQIPAVVLEPDPGLLACLRKAIAANALQRPLNLIEISRCLQKLASCLPERRQLVHAAQALGLPTNQSVIDKIIGLVHLPLPVQEGILDDSLALSMAVELGSMDAVDAVEFTRLFQLLKLSLNKQREMLTLVKEISRREDISIQDVLQDRRIRKVLSDDNPDWGRNAREIRSLLHHWRYPGISKAQQQFEKRLKELKLGPDLKLIPPKNFEGTTYALQLTFDDLDRLKMLQTALDRIIRHPSIHKIMERKEVTKVNE
jgi:ParB family chromosome partitioning protein